MQSTRKEQPSYAHNKRIKIYPECNISSLGIVLFMKELKVSFPTEALNYVSGKPCRFIRQGFAVI